MGNRFPSAPGTGHLGVAARAHLRLAMIPVVRPDFGHFVLPDAPNEPELIRNMVRQATMNTKRPSEQWSTMMKGTVRQRGYVVEGFRILHVDVANRRLEVTEEWGGVITARKNLPLGTIG